MLYYCSTFLFGGASLFNFSLTKKKRQPHRLQRCQQWEPSGHQREFTGCCCPPPFCHHPRPLRSPGWVTGLGRATSGEVVSTGRQQWCKKVPSSDDCTCDRHPPPQENKAGILQIGVDSIPLREVQDSVALFPWKMALSEFVYFFMSSIHN